MLVFHPSVEERAQQAADFGALWDPRALAPVLVAHLPDIVLDMGAEQRHALIAGDSLALDEIHKNRIAVGLGHALRVLGET